MRTSNMRARKFSSTIGKTVMALVFAAMIGSISIAPALGSDNDRRAGYYDHGRYQRSHPKYNRYKSGYDRHGRRVYQSSRRYRYYRAPGYSPYYYDPTPYRSPGINLFFPLYIR